MISESNEEAEFNKFMQEYGEQEKIYNEEIVIHNEKILKIHNISIEDIMDILEFCQLSGKIEEVERPIGNEQFCDDTEKIKNIHVEQYNDGACEDSFHGFIYGKTKIGWIKIPYNC